MKKAYEAPRAEKFDFLYEENVTASSSAPPTDDLDPIPTSDMNPKKGKDNSGCYKGNATGDRGCAVYN